MTKQQVYKEELDKLNEIFKDVDESKKKLVDGLIQDAAFLFAENYILKETLDKTGMVKINPVNPGMQKPIPSAKEYRQNLNSYAVVIKTLNTVLEKGIKEEEDDLDEFE